MGFGLLPKKCIKKAELEDLLGPSSSRDGPPLWPLLPCDEQHAFLSQLAGGENTACGCDTEQS